MADEEGIITGVEEASTTRGRATIGVADMEEEARVWVKEDLEEATTMEDLEVDITEEEEGMEVRMVDMVDSRMVGMEVKEDLEGDMTTGIQERVEEVVWVEGIEVEGIEWEVIEWEVREEEGVDTLRP